MIANYQISNQDNKAFFEQSQQFESMLFSINNNLIFKNNQLSLNSGVNYNVFTIADVKTTLVGGTIGIGKAFYENKMNVNFSASFNKRLLNDADNGNTLSSYLNYSFQPSQAHSFTFNFGFLKSIEALENEFSETRGSIGYAYRIGTKK